MTAPNYHFRNGEHFPCPVCGGPVLRRSGEVAGVWKQRATCSRECLREARGEALRHRVLPRDLPLSKAQIGEWPKGIRFEDLPTAPVSHGSVGLPPLSHSAAGGSAAACVAHPWAGR